MIPDGNLDIYILDRVIYTCNDITFFSHHGISKDAYSKPNIKNKIMRYSL